MIVYQTATFRSLGIANRLYGYAIKHVQSVTLICVACKMSEKLRTCYLLQSKMPLKKFGGTAINLNHI